MAYQLFLLIVILPTACLASLPDFVQDDGISKDLTVCGGTIESDSGVITYSGSPTLSRGDECVWVIHLQARMWFSFNFSKFDINSGFLDCRDGGVRIYALTNLVGPDESQRYSFCYNDPPPEEFFLGHTIAVVILHIGSQNLSPGSGFELNWSGRSIDPLRTKHASAYSTLPEGIVKYPVTGTYPTSVAATWLFKPVSNVDLSISKIGLEECSLDGGEDRCACDALILYQIGTSGQLNETKRMCGEEASVDFSNLKGTFLLAFFTDLEDLRGGTGFTARYYPNQNITPATQSPTTTSESETTRTTNTVTSTVKPGHRCGGMLQGTPTWQAINYKPHNGHGPHERCTWTIDGRNHTTFSFKLLQPVFDRLAFAFVTSFTNADVPLMANHRISSSNTTFESTVPGSLAIITFATGNESNYGGLYLYFRSVGPTPDNTTRSSRDDSVLVAEQELIMHPVEPGYYKNYELSSFLVNKPNYQFNGESLRYNFHEKKQGSINDNDFVEAYQFHYPGGWTHYRRLTTNNGIFEHDDIVLFIFVSNYINPGTGFIIDVTRRINSTTGSVEIK
ncbi:uncharacterized protein LOC110860114 [Folsomia candida]|uniref:uncharacterized protein LOC110860114 n=1 Tax=Folsomia candida TaxID=158441 RepID=UPI000B8FDF87|nr:uncharacterized protein LOC110860114 [Folsomia candida]